MKQILGIYSAARPHWVGDGFPVRTLFSYDSLGEHLSPFLLLDHAGPHAFGPSTVRRGVGQHPHRGFETVTLVYDGELEHRDSSGGGRIGPGDVQWMTGAGRIAKADHVRVGADNAVIKCVCNVALFTIRASYQPCPWFVFAKRSMITVTLYMQDAVESFWE